MRTLALPFHMGNVECVTCQVPCIHSGDGGGYVGRDFEEADERVCEEGERRTTAEGGEGVVTEGFGVWEFKGSFAGPSTCCPPGSEVSAAAGEAEGAAGGSEGDDISSRCVSLPLELQSGWQVARAQAKAKCMCQ
jgi:hypothetical protein